MIICPGCFTHFSFFVPLLCSSVSLSRLARQYIAASTLFSHSSGRPCVGTSSSKGCSPSGECMIVDA